MQKNLWSDLSFVKRSKERTTIALLLVSPKTPTELKHEAKMYISNVSRTLDGLVKRGLVLCLTPNEVRGRYFELTKKGKAVSKLLSE